MRVLMVINGLGTGGAERSTSELLPLLVRHGIEPVVACLWAKSEGVQGQVEALGVTVIVLPGSTLVAKTWSLRRLCQRLRPDVIHTAVFEADQIGRIASLGGP